MYAFVTNATIYMDVDKKLLSSDWSCLYKIYQFVLLKHNEVY
jgi:hypothetical protein